MIISITSLKGGVGKSTISQNLAVCFAHMGYKVAIVDADLNDSCERWSGMRDNEEHPPVMVVSIDSPQALRNNVKLLARDYEIIIITTKGTTIPAYFLLNEYSEKMTFNQDSKEALEDLKFPIQAYKEVVADGIGVYEYGNRDAKKEIALLANEILGILQETAV